MDSSKQQYVGLKWLAKQYAISLQKASKALVAAQIRLADGAPAQPHFAQSRPSSYGGTQYLWDRDLAFRAFQQAGFKVPSSLDSYCYVQNRYQAQSKMDHAFEMMGEACGLDRALERDPEKYAFAYSVYESAKFHDMHILGGPVAILQISDQDQCVTFINTINDVLSRYEASCQGCCKGQKQLREVAFYGEAIRRLAAWVQLQFFR